MNSIEERNRLFLEHKEIAEGIARRKKRSCVAGVQLSELRSAAYFGLLDAASRFDVTKGDFSKYAKIRIYGEINDYLRDYYKTRRVNVMKSWSLEVPAYTNNSNRLSPLSDIIGSDDKATLSNKEALSKMLKPLSDHYRKIFMMYFIDDMTMKEIGVIIGLGECAVSKIIKDSKEIIRKHFNSDIVSEFSFSRKSSVNFSNSMK